MNSEVKYDRIGIGYNDTRKADPRIVSILLKEFGTLGPEPILDLGCGSGNYTIALHHHGLDMIGVDPSQLMLGQAKQSSKPINWLVGSADSIPLDNHSVSATFAMLTIHHWDDLHVGFREIRRVVQPEGRFVLFTAFPQQMQGYWLNHYFPGMMADSMEQMPSPDRLRNALNANGWQIKNETRLFIEPDHCDMFLYCGKHHPERYLDERIRHGISSFSDLAYDDEVSLGLKKMEIDIQSGKFREIKRKFENKLGDYVILTST